MCACTRETEMHINAAKGKGPQGLGAKATGEKNRKRRQGARETRKGGRARREETDETQRREGATRTACGGCAGSSRRCCPPSPAASPSCGCGSCPGCAAGTRSSRASSPTATPAGSVASFARTLPSARRCGGGEISGERGDGEATHVCQS